MDAAELAASALLHDGADSAGIALQLALHLLKELQTGADRVEPDTGVRGLLLQGLAPLRSGAAAQTVAVDAVLRGRDIGLRFGELLLCGLERALCLCTAALRRLQILCQLGLPLRALGKTLFHGGQVRAAGGELLTLPALQIAQGEIALCHAVGGVRQSAALLLGLLLLFGQRGGLRVDLAHALLQCFDLRGDAAAAAVLILQLVLHALQVALRVAAIRLQHGDPAALLLRGGLRLPDRITDLIRLQVAVVEVERQGFRGDIELVQRVVLLLQDEGGGMIVLLGLARRGAQALERLQPQRDLEALELLAVGQVALCLFRLIAQRADLQLQLRDLVADAGQIVLRRGEAALRFLLAVAVFRDTGGLLENFAAVRALEGQNFVDASLADVGIAVAAETGIHEQLVDVAQTHALLVDVVFALAGAVIPARDHQLVGVIMQGAVAVVQHERRLGKADGGALLRAAENDILHLLAAQRAGILLAHDPADGI